MEYFCKTRPRDVRVLPRRQTATPWAHTGKDGGSMGGKEGQQGLRIVGLDVFLTYGQTMLKWNQQASRTSPGPR